MDLVRDLLDNAVVDRKGREMGRVDGIVLEIRDGAPPRVAAIEIAPGVLAHRVHPFFGRCMVAFGYVFHLRDPRPLVIPLGDRLQIGDRVKVDMDVGDTVAGEVEQRLRRWVRAVGGGA